MGLLDILKAGVQGTAAARTGYLAGEDQEHDKQKAEALTAMSIDRNSRLDALRQAMDAAQERRANAQADWYEKRDTTPKPAPPHTISTSGGIMQWNPTSGKFEPTGLQPPETASDRSAPRIEANQHRIAMQQEIGNATRQASDVTRQITDAQKATGFKPGERKSLIDRLAPMRDEFLRVRDSTVAAGRSPTFESTPRTPGPGVVPFDPVVPGSRVAQLRTAVKAPAPARGASAAQGAYDDAAARYKKALGMGIPADQAQAAYDATVKQIAQQHGQLPEE